MTAFNGSLCQVPNTCLWRGSHARPAASVLRLQHACYNGQHFTALICFLKTAALSAMMTVPSPRNCTGPRQATFLKQEMEML